MVNSVCRRLRAFYTSTVIITPNRGSRNEADMRTVLASACVFVIVAAAVHAQTVPAIQREHDREAAAPPLPT
jgi:hypothetical protein